MKFNTKISTILAQNASGQLVFSSLLVKLYEIGVTMFSYFLAALQMFS